MDHLVPAEVEALVRRIDDEQDLACLIGLDSGVGDQQGRMSLTGSEAHVPEHARRQEIVGIVYDRPRPHRA